MLRDLLTSLAAAPKGRTRLVSTAAIIQIIVSGLTILGLLFFGGLAIQRLDYRIKTAELPSKEINAAFDKQHRIRVEHSPEIEPIKSSAPADT
jgi:hypothetical protein